MAIERNTSKLLTVQEAAERLAIKPATIRSWILRGIHLEVVKVGRSVRITQNSIEKFIEQNTIHPKPEPRSR
jgi:excisionase family DNA binding protein